MQSWCITNENAHPNRYWSKNKQKFINLYRVSKHINGNLWLVNYSKKLQDNISLISVKSIDSGKGITEDVGYLLSYEELLDWLKLNQKSREEGLLFLQNKPKQERNKNFWLQENWRNQFGNYS